MVWLYFHVISITLAIALLLFLFGAEMELKEKFKFWKPCLATLLSQPPLLAGLCFYSVKIIEDVNKKLNQIGNQRLKK